MKIFSVLALGATIFFAASCKDQPAEQTEKPADADKGLKIAGTLTENKTETLCFLHTEGTKNQDTTTVKLVMIAGKVAGDMNYMPAEKDRRTGTVTGEKHGDELNLKFQYMQEGMEQSIPVVFKLSGGNLWQKAWAYDSKTGVEFVPDTASYTREYQPVDCK
jgi:hypothetical protein